MDEKNLKAEETENQPENVRQESSVCGPDNPKKLNRKIIPVIACASCALVTAVIAIALQSPILLVIALILLVPVVILLVRLLKPKLKARKRRLKHSFLPYWGIIAEIACAPLFLLFVAMMFNGIAILRPIAIVFIAAALACPVFGIAAGITAVARGRSKTGTAGFVMGIIDIVLPPLAVMTTLLLLSTNVVVISLM